MAEGSWDVVHVLYAATDKATGAISCQLGDVKSREIIEPSAPVFQIWGALSLPAVPIAGVAAAEAVTLNTSSGNVVIGGRSVRSAEIAGLLKMGESAFFADGSRASTLYKLDGSIVHYTTIDNTKDGRAVAQWITPTGFRQEWPWGRTRLDSTGFHVQHLAGTKVCRFDVGSIAAPAPLDSFSTYFTIQAEMGRIDSSFVAIGPTGAVFSPVARADAVLAALVAIRAQLSALTTAVNSLAATPAASGVSPGATGGVTTAIAALTTAATVAATALTAAAVGTLPVTAPIGSSSLAAT